MCRSPRVGDWLRRAVGLPPRARRRSPPAPRPRHPDFVFPALPPGADAIQATRIERGWRFLQSDDLRGAEREFASALQRDRTFHPADRARLRRARAQRRRRCPAALRAGARAAQRPTRRRWSAAAQALLTTGPRRRGAGQLRGRARGRSGADRPAARIEVLRFRAVQDRVARAVAARDAGRFARSPRGIPRGHRGLARFGLPLSRSGARRAQGGRARRGARALPQGAGARSVRRRGRTLRWGPRSSRSRATSPARSRPTNRRARSTRSPASRAVARARRLAMPRCRPQYHAIAGRAGGDPRRPGRAARRAAGRGAGRRTAAPDWSSPTCAATGRSPGSSRRRAPGHGGVPNHTFQPARGVRRGDVADVVSRVLALSPRPRRPGRAGTRRPVDACRRGAGHLATPRCAARWPPVS